MHAESLPEFPLLAPFQGAALSDDRATAQFALRVQCGQGCPRSNTLPSAFVAKDGAEDCCDCNRRSNAYEDYGQHRVSMTAVVIHALHVCVMNGRRGVSLTIAHHELFIAGAVNIALHLRAIVQCDGGARF